MVRFSRPRQGFGWQPKKGLGMSSDSTSPQRTICEAASLVGLTPIMDESDLRRAVELSMIHVRPPLHVPGYEQETFVGRGAFGEVWKAVDSNSGRVVAIKFYNRRGGLDWSHMSREVEKLQYLFSDRHVVQLLEVGWEANPPYYVMEYMEHGSLEDRLKAGAMTVTEAVTMIRNVALGLVGAHDRGILHCDLKPDNIMLDEDGNPRLADFGQSRLKREHAPAVGTLFYMAPEQAELSMIPDARWDVYALGAILYRMLTGNLPYLTEETTHSVSSQTSVQQRLKAYSQSLQTLPPPTDHNHVPGVDSSLGQIVDRCLAVNPKRRYPNVQSVLHALALRESKLSQRPLLTLGILAPAAAVLLLSLVSVFLFTRTLGTARSLLLERTSESNQFAAKSVAARFAIDIDQRWQILEQEAAQGPLIQWLQRDDLRAAPNDVPTEVPLWLRGRYEHWNSRFSKNTTASYWYVLDLHGVLRAIEPTGQEEIGNYYGYREYFHGLGTQLNREDPVPKAIREAHRSNVFHSQPTNRPAVSLSVPIRDADGGQILGVLAMEAELGHFAEFQGSRNQTAVLVDLRPDESASRGLIVEHPRFDDLLQANRRLDAFYVSASTLAILDAPRGGQVRARDANIDWRSSPNAAASTFPRPFVLDSYHDPVGDATMDDLVAVVEPVIFRREADKAVDSGWILLVQERRSEILEPIARLRSMVIFGGLTALILVASIMAGLWWLVTYVQNAPNRLRASRMGNGRLPSDSSSTASDPVARGPAAAETKAEHADRKQLGKVSP